MSDSDNEDQLAFVLRSYSGLDDDDNGTALVRAAVIAAVLQIPLFSDYPTALTRFLDFLTTDAHGTFRAIEHRSSYSNA